MLDGVIFIKNNEVGITIIIHNLEIITLEVTLKRQNGGTSREHLWLNTGKGIIEGKYLIFSRFDTLSYVENQYWIFILEPEILLFHHSLQNLISNSPIIYHIRPF